MRTLILLMASLLLFGCASQSHAPTTQAACAECTVCKHNADLACVEVDVTANTPRAEYAGKTYYFCSEDCRSEFVKHPEKYARH